MVLVSILLGRLTHPFRNLAVTECKNTVKLSIDGEKSLRAAKHKRVIEET